nr:tetratricopeptide repeat protein [Muribaculaceae bacterium]
MRLPRFFAALICAAVATGASIAQSGLNDPMTKAMMDIYNQEITANPQAYDIYFRRANEYYKFDQYLRALSDIDNALKYAPAEDSDMRFQCYSLRGDIYQMLGKYEDALADYTQALNIDPTSFMALYQKANTEYELGRYAEAKVDYNRLRANNGRSAEALTGLARVAVKENNLGQAAEYMDDAVQMMPADSDVYVRRSSVRRMLGNNTGAVDDLIMAISIDSNPKAFSQLVEISNIDYPAVVTALSNAVHHAPDQGMFYYIRGVIAQAHNHFPAAIEDFQKIIDENMYNYAGIYGSLAECHYALCDYERALENINQAIGMGADNGDYHITLSKICR